MLNIWFNRTYATTVHVIGLLRANPDGAQVRIFGTHSDPDSPLLAACDLAEPEPHEGVVGDEYVAWALAFCARHRIDVFFPRLHLEILSAAREEFEASGVSLVAGPAEAAALLNDKAGAYREAEAAGVAVPPFRVVRCGSDLIRSYEELSADGSTVCMKPVKGAGGVGFRVLTRDPLRWDDVVGALKPRVHVDEAAAAMCADEDAGRRSGPVMLLPYLHGPEVSVDCLAGDTGILVAAVPRVKFSRRRQLVDDTAAVGVARRIVAHHRLSALSNTQVRYWRRPGVDSEPRPYLLETNARMSGGLYQTALSGLNLPWAAVQMALGQSVALPAPLLGRAFTTVSSIVALSS